MKKRLMRITIVAFISIFILANITQANEKSPVSKNVAPAPIAVEILLTEEQMDDVNLSVDSETDGVAVNKAGTLMYYFDSDSGTDSVFRWDFISSPTIYVTESQMTNVPSLGSSSAADMTVDINGNLWLMNSNVANGFSTILWRIPPSGFNNAVLIAEGQKDSTTSIAIDETNNRIVVSDGFFSPAQTRKIYAYPLNTAAGASSTTIAEAPALTAALSGLPTYVSAIEDDFIPFDLTVQSNGNIIISHNGSHNGNATTRTISGSLVQVTANGDASLFMAATDLVTAGGGTPGTDFLRWIHLDTLNDDKILTYVRNADPGTMDGYVAIIEADGSAINVIGTNTQLAAFSPSIAAIAATNAVSSQADGRLFGDGNMRAFALDGNNNYYFYKQAKRNMGGVGANAPGGAIMRLLNIPSVPTTLNITFPTASALLPRGDTHTITWDRTGSISPVNIFVLGGSSTTLQALNVPNTGSFDLFFPTSLEPRNDYILLIVSTQNGAINDTSPPFEIFPNNTNVNLPWHKLE